MDGKLVTGIGLLAAPTAGIAAAVAWFSSNPVAIFAMLALMLVGAFYLLTYSEVFG